MQVGKLQRAENGMTGYIVCRALDAKLTLRSHPRAGNMNAPRWEIFAKQGGASEYSIGSAWEKKIERGDNAGGKMLSITFDDPSMDKPLYVTAFPDGDGFEIVWQRARAGVREFRADERVEDFPL